MNNHYPFSRTGLVVTQPFGEFLVVSIPASLLLDVAYSDRLTAERRPDGSYSLGGSQRARAERRLTQIGQYIDTPSAAFPNAIILAANYREEDGLIEEEENRKWSLSIDDDGLAGKLQIPTRAKLAPIIDGQHRLFGFNYAKEQARLDMPLLCAIFFDLPKPFQAFLFATINANQRPVSKSLTYELFGYNVEDESPGKWTPEKLAVFLSRKLGAETDSPFCNHIIIAAENDFAPRMADVRREHGWAVSIATVVEGIVKLISKNPKRDASTMGGNLSYLGKDRSALQQISDSSPLRRLYLSGSDDRLYTGIRNFFAAADKTLWMRARPGSYIRKTVGIQALFDLARRVMKDMADKKDFRTAEFERTLQFAARVDFADSFFQTSGTGRQRIRNCLELSLGFKTLNEIGPDRQEYERLTKSPA
jgi:DNA phosphorothioation-associated DGQHR protein 1